jgi:chorismate mutase
MPIPLLFQSRSVTLNQRPLTVFGPCSAESEQQVLETARAIHAYFPNNLFRAGIWKPRTRPGGFEGAGVPGLAWLSRVREELGMPVCTEVANTTHVEAVLEHGVDAVWIGARTTVNPFMVQEIADALKGTGMPVMVKNPVNPDTGLWIGAVERMQRAGLHYVAALHRGFHSFETSGYRNAPRWELAIDFRTALPEVPIICDASHISGDPNLIPAVSQKAMDLDFDGLMIETHPEPTKALSDARQQITPEHLHRIMDALVVRSAHSGKNEVLDRILELRARIDAADDQLLQSLIHRMQQVGELGKYKKSNDVTILQMNRWEEILQRQMRNGAGSGLSAGFIKRLYELIHEESIRIQTEIFQK